MSFLDALKRLLAPRPRGMEPHDAPALRDDETRTQDVDMPDLAQAPEPTAAITEGDERDRSDVDVAAADVDVALPESDLADSALEVEPPADTPQLSAAAAHAHTPELSAAPPSDAPQLPVPPAVGVPASIGLVLQLDVEGSSPSTFAVGRPGATLGRGEENAIRVNDLSVSRRHARITFRQGAFWISDLGSTSGTWVDGTRLTAPRRLEPGQVIDVGVRRLTVSQAVPPLGSDAASSPRVARTPRRRTT